MSHVTLTRLQPNMASSTVTLPPARSNPQHHPDDTHSNKSKTSYDLSRPSTPHFTSIIPSENAKEQEKIKASHEEHNNHSPLTHTTSNISHHDIPAVPSPSRDSDDDSIYDRFTPARKRIITAVMAFSGFLAPISSTTVLSAVPEVADTFGCDGAVVNLSNAM